MKIRCESNYDDDTDQRKFINRLTCGARRVDRGSAFTAYIPLSDQQQISGQTISFGGNCGYVSDIQHSSRLRCISVSNSDRIVVTLDNTIANDFKGRFHVYLRHRITGEFTGQIACRSHGNVWYSEVITLPATSFCKIADFGSVTLPPAGTNKDETVEEIVFWIDLTAISPPPGSPIEVYDLIIIPADEWIGSFFSHNLYGPNLDGLNYMDIDSITVPKKDVYSPVRTISSDNLESQWTNANIGPIRLEGEQQTRLWFVCWSFEIITGTKFEYGKFSYCSNTQLAISRQYKSAIGEAY